MLTHSGAALIDADAISRATTAPGGAAISQIAARFGQDAITADGAMDRDAMRNRVFTDSSARRQLEAIIHPLVRLESDRLALKARQDGRALLVFDIPLLVESQRWRDQLGQVLVVDCDETTQLSRVMMRSGWTAEAVLKIIAQQATRSERLAAADRVIYNQHMTLDELAWVVKQIADHITL